MDKSLIGPYILGITAIVLAIGAVIIAFIYGKNDKSNSANDSSSDSSIDVDTITIGNSKDTNYTLPSERTLKPTQFLGSEENGVTSWQFALPTNESNDVNVNNLLTVGTVAIGTIDPETQTETVTPPFSTYILPSILPTAGQFLAAGTINPAITTWESFENNNTTAFTVQRITVSGTYTLPAGCRYVSVEIQAAGAAGVRIDWLEENETVLVGSSGGGGQYIKAMFTAGQIADLNDKTIIVGEAGMTDFQADIQPGGNSSFGGFIAKGGQPGTENLAKSAAAPGGEGGSDDMLIQNTGTVIQNIPGGDGHVSTGQYVTTDLKSLFSGSGGNSVLGYGGSGFSSTFSGNFEHLGLMGTGFGAGGGGTGSYADATFVPGGNGRAGIVIFTEFY
jgi:hypothetical protein